MNTLEKVDTYLRQIERLAAAERPDVAAIASEAKMARRLIQQEIAKTPKRGRA